MTYINTGLAGAAQMGSTAAELLWLVSLYTERPSKATWTSCLCKAMEGQTACPQDSDCLPSGQLC